jgi:hypothetical protein
MKTALHVGMLEEAGMPKSLKLKLPQKIWDFKFLPNTMECTGDRFGNCPL